MVREYEGRVAVFAAEGGDKPEAVWKTLVKYLPDDDRARRKEGIPVDSFENLMARIEADAS